MPRLTCCASLLLVLVFVATNPTAAQSVERTPPPDTRALLFQAVSNISFTSFSGSTLSMKWQHTASRAARVGLSLSSRLLFGGDDDSQHAGARLEYLLLTYAETQTSIQCYYGVGPSVDFSYQRQGRGDTDAYTSLRGGLGVAGVLGVEWFPVDAISIVGEYGSSLMLLYDSRSNGNDDESYYGVSLNAWGARAGVSLYF